MKRKSIEPDAIFELNFHYVNENRLDGNANVRVHGTKIRDFSVGVLNVSKQPRLNVEEDQQPENQKGET
ncbi:hypothetical protein V3C99_012205 [Haemonchus contortus]